MASLEGKPMTREKRAKLYFRLMDITFVLALIGLSEVLLDEVFRMELIKPSDAMYWPIAVFFRTMNFLLPTFLLLARFMRDEYAELLWQRTTAILTYVVTAIPAILAAGAMVLISIGVDKPVGIYAYLYATKQSLFNAIIISWMAYMLLFVAIFQFVRWRDSR
jgi:hypothetical protein